MSKVACCVLAVHLTTSWALADDSPVRFGPETVLATVGNETITEADFQLYAAMNNISRDEQPPARSELLDQLIDRRLVRQALRRQKITPNPNELADSITKLKDLIRSRKEDPAAVLKRLGLTQAVLEDQLGLPIAWGQFVRSSVMDEQIAAYFQEHRAEFDGTKVRASQIFLKLPPDAPQTEIDDRKKRLSEIRQEIVAKKISFADAAKKYSAAPSKNQGGDVGWFPLRGVMLISFSNAAFALKTGEISEPVVSSLGVHLIQATDRQPGEFTLEDVRRDVITQLDKQLWNETVAAERKKTKVTIHISK